MTATIPTDLSKRLRDRASYISGRDGARTAEEFHREAADAIDRLMAQNASIREALAQLRKFMDDAPKLDFNEDVTLSWMAFMGAKVELILAKIERLDRAAARARKDAQS